ncbi:MAG: RNA polymerase sigma factor [Solirubrobacterales bacterium]
MTELKETQAPGAKPYAQPPKQRQDADFDALYRDSRDDLYAYLAFLLSDRSLAEEVTAQAFERAFRRRASFDPLRGDLRAWLFRIARNAAIDELRRGKHTSSLAFDEVELQASVDAPVGETIDRITVAAAVRTLEPRRRELVALKFFAGLSNIEIARVVGQSESNVGSQLHRAIKQLREALDD